MVAPAGQFRSDTVRQKSVADACPAQMKRAVTATAAADVALMLRFMCACLSSARPLRRSFQLFQPCVKRHFTLTVRLTAFDELPAASFAVIVSLYLPFFSLPFLMTRV